MRTVAISRAAVREKLHGVKEFFEAFAPCVAIAFSLALGAILTVACGATEQPANPTQSSVTATPTGAPSPLLGTWSRTQTCSELVGVLERAGIPTQNVLDAVAGSELIPGVTNGANNIADPAHPCAGAVPRTHSHFFRAGGAWGSLDYNGQQVDDGHFQIVDDHTVVINAVTFHYRLIDANTIVFDPVLPKCAQQGCFNAEWALSVAYPSYQWKRSGP